MKKSLKLRHWLLIGMCLLLFVSFPLPFLMEFVGFYTLNPGWEVAEILVKKEKGVEGCSRIRRAFWWDVLSPPGAEQRALCIHRYAKLTKDPSACELLMPSGYGWSCLGAAEKPNSRLCWFNFAPDPPEVGSGNMRVTLPDCAKNPSAMTTNRCCELARILYIDEEESCAALQNSDVLHDQCVELLARRDRNVDICTDIHDDHIRASCEVAVRALLNVPNASP